MAARAGVGIGTLYRHFPNRDALVIAAYRHEVDVLCAAAKDLLAGQTADRAVRAWAVRAWAVRAWALCAWAERVADYIATKRIMAAALRAAAFSESPLLMETRERILAAVRLLLDAGIADGTLWADANPHDVLRVMNGIWFLPAGPDWRDTVGRVLDLVIDGLRYGAPARTNHPER